MYRITIYILETVSTLSVFTTQIDNILVDDNLTLSLLSEENEFVGSTPLLYCSGYLLGRVVIPNVNFVYKLSGNDNFGNPFAYTNRLLINKPTTDTPTTDTPTTASTTATTASTTATTASTTATTAPPSTNSPSTNIPTTSTNASTTNIPTTSTNAPTTNIPTTSTNAPTTNIPTTPTDPPTTPSTRNPYALQNIFNSSVNKSINIGSRASIYFGLISTTDARSVLSFNILATTSPTDLMLRYEATITVKRNNTKIINVSVETRNTNIPGSYVVTVTASSGDLILTNSQNVTLVKVSLWIQDVYL